MLENSVSLHCPHCRHATAVSPAPLSKLDDVRHVNVLGSIGSMLVFTMGGASWWIGKCNHCEMPLLICDGGRLVYPTPRPGPVSEHIPEPMRSDLRDAKHCVAAGVFNAAVVMARRALQCAAVEQGAPSGHGWQLWKQIKWLDENRKITPSQHQLADAARWVGNHGAHDTEPDVAAGQPVITNVTDEDARDTIQLVEHLFETLYVAPKLAQEQLAKRGKLGEPPK